MRNLKEPQGKTVPELIKDKRLYILDYKELRTCKKFKNFYFYAPVMLVYKQTSGPDKGSLAILGILLDINSQFVYTPQMEHKNRWYLAKLFVQLADCQVHEFISHLGTCHLGLEPIIVAVHNCFPEDHPIHQLLNPHFEGTININYIGRKTLVAEKHPWMDGNFSIGANQGSKIFGDKWATYDFFKDSFPEQLKARGFDEQKTDGVEDYLYRDDGFMIWNAIGEYATGSVNSLFKDDQSVEKDNELKNWCTEMTTVARIPGFPTKLTTKKLLANVLQIIIWHSSALHSAINFPQWPYLGLISNRPSAMCAPMPDEDGTDIPDDYIKKALPSGFCAVQCIGTAWALTMPSDIMLTDVIALKNLYPDVHHKFMSRLDEVSKKMEVRNQNLKNAGKIPYWFLYPKNVANSINA